MSPLEISLPIQLTNGNDGRGSKWFRSDIRRKRIARQLTYLGHVRKPFRSSVDLTITRVLGPRERLWDADSIGRGSAKELIDALVECGWFHDDGPKWIRNCDYRQTIDRANGPAVIVKVECI